MASSTSASVGSSGDLRVALRRFRDAPSALVTATKPSSPRDGVAGPTAHCKATTCPRRRDLCEPRLLAPFTNRRIFAYGPLGVERAVQSPIARVVAAILRSSSTRRADSAVDSTRISSALTSFSQSSRTS